MAIIEINSSALDNVQQLRAINRYFDSVIEVDESVLSKYRQIIPHEDLKFYRVQKEGVPKGDALLELTLNKTLQGIEILGCKIMPGEKPFKMSRESVLSTISDERDFQNEMGKSGERADIIPEFHIGDTLSAIQYNLDLARKEWYTGAVPHQGALEYLRKIAGLCVQAGETYGMPIIFTHLSSFLYN